ncbi:MAG: DUF4350 domain-containing protein [Gammaproteobacteria bacterium]|nr:DUF4350 domain-containing protein [Gammaproteobacteria bacterium]
MARTLPPLSARLRTLVLVGAASIAVVACWRWFLENFERRERVEYVGMSEAAHRNPFLALELVLRELGYRVESVAGRDKLIHLPDPHDVLVVNNAGPALAPDREAALLDWLDNGGHLVIEARRFWDEKEGASGDRLLDGLGIELHQLEGPVLAAVPDKVHEIAAVRFDGDPGPVQVDFFPTYYLVDGGKRARSGVAAGHVEGAYHLLQIPVGLGQVTVTSDSAFLRNRALGRLDHAYYAASLLGRRDGSRVWLLYDSAVEPLPLLVWKRAPAFVIAAAALAAAAALGTALRFGPIRGEDLLARRDLTQHLDAAAHFLWRTRERALLLGAARARVLRAWTSRHPELARLEQRELAAAIAAAVGEPVAAVEQALAAPVDDEAALITASRSLQRLARQGPTTKLHQDGHA